MMAQPNGSQYLVKSAGAGCRNRIWIAVCENEQVYDGGRNARNIATAQSAA
jgi:hypothetical protein